MLGIFQCCYFVGVHVQSFLWSNLTWKFVDAPPHCWLLVCTLPQLSSTRLFFIGFFCAPALEVFFPRSIPSASRWSDFELSCMLSWEVCLVPFSTFVQHFSFFWAAIFLGLGFCFLWALNPCLSSHTSPISWLPPFWGWADVFTVHLGLSIYSFTVLHLFTPNFTWQRLL